MNYDEVRAAVHGYMHRSDIETIDNEPTALELARVTLARDFFPESASVLVTLPVLEGVADLPADFGQADTVKDPGGGDLLYETPRGWARRVGDKTTRGWFTVNGAQLLCDGALGSVVLLYYKTPPAIGPGQSSWLSEQYPDVWIWAGIAEQHRFVQDFESAKIAEDYAFSLAGEAVMRTRANTRGGALRMNPRR